jgi:hypothetical protein
MNAKLFGFFLFVSALLGLTEVVVAAEARIWSSVLPIPPQTRFVGCEILNVSRKAISGEVAMFGPGGFGEGNVGMGSVGFGPLEPERIVGGVASLAASSPSLVFCRITFDGREGDVKGSLTLFSEGQVPIFTIPFE